MRLSFDDFDEVMMRQALLEAELAASQNEVPVGAVVVKNGEIIGRGHNSQVKNNDPCAHAEMMAIRAACERIQSTRLLDCTLYITLEPCAMCAGAIINAQIPRIIYGAKEPKTGAAGSVINLFGVQNLNHHAQITGGILAEDSSLLLQQFFMRRRHEKMIERDKAQAKLREDMVRPNPKTVKACLEWVPKNARSIYKNDWKTAKNVRLHSIEYGDVQAHRMICIPPLPLWSVWFNAFIKNNPVNYFSILDRLGCGLSDKPKRYNSEWEQVERALVVEWLLLQMKQVFSLVIHPTDDWIIQSASVHDSSFLNQIIYWDNGSEDAIEMAIKGMDPMWCAPFDSDSHKKFSLWCYEERKWKRSGSIKLDR